MIQDMYIVHLRADDLPGFLSADRMLPTFADHTAFGGYPLGVREDNNTVLFNHLDFTIFYHDVSTTGAARVLGLQIHPRSIAHDSSNPRTKCADFQPPLLLEPDAPQQVIEWTYSVRYAPSPVEWATRWDALLKAPPKLSQIHWLSLSDGFLITLLLGSSVAAILTRTVLRDIARYNRAPDPEEMAEEYGWKVIAGDVFRQPYHSKLLATCTGTGIQVSAMAALTLVFALIGLVSPVNRGNLIVTMLVLFAVMGGPGGFVSARLTKFFMRDQIKSSRPFIVTMWTGLMFTGVCMATFLGLNLLLAFKRSSATLSFRDLLTIFGLWLGVSVPMVFIGSYMGYRKTAIDVPVPANQFAREIPKQRFFVRWKLHLLLAGVLPFGVAFSELSSIVNNLWVHQYYTLFGCLSTAAMLLALTCAETSIVFTYLQICREDYRWWWDSWLASGSCAVYFFVFSIFNLFTHLSIQGGTAVTIYLVYTLLMTYGIFLITGSIGFLSAFFFVNAIYKAVRVD